MKRYNKRYRGLAETTDILSFVTAELPFCEEDITFAEDDYPGKPIRFCDIIIDINQLLYQRDSNNIEDNYRTVLILSLIHISEPTRPY